MNKLVPFFMQNINEWVSHNYLKHIKLPLKKYQIFAME